MSADAPPPQPRDAHDLQFDRAVPASQTSDAASQTMACASCAAPLRTWYFDVEGQPHCSACKQKAQQRSGAVREWGTTLRAALLGLGAAVAGAIIYYGVIAITDFEIGIVALLIGYMVGFSVRKGSHGRGGRLLQVIAAALTYFSVSLAYLPLAMKGTIDAALEGDSTAIVSDSAAVVADAPNAEAAAPDSLTGAAAAQNGVQVNPLLAVGMLIVFALALPLIVVFGSLPSGLISALIIGVGMRQAWVMTRATELTIAGPFRVGRSGDADSAQPASTAA
jgi:hypothetical protein